MRAAQGIFNGCLYCIAIYSVIILFAVKCNGQGLQPWQLEYPPASPSNAWWIMAAKSGGEYNHEHAEWWLTDSLGMTGGDTCHWKPWNTNRIFYPGRVAISQDTAGVNTLGIASLYVTNTNSTSGIAGLIVKNLATGDGRDAQLYVHSNANSYLDTKCFGTGAFTTLFGTNLSVATRIQSYNPLYINTIGGTSADLRMGANSTERFTIKGDSGVFMPNLATGTASNALFISPTGQILKGSAPGGGGVTGVGAANRVAWWNGTSSLTRSNNFLYDDSGSKLLLGPSLDTAASWVPQHAGMAIRGSNTAGISLVGGSYDLWNMYMDDSGNKFAIKNDIGANDGLKLEYTASMKPSFYYLTQAQAAQATTDRIVLGNTGTGELKLLSQQGSIGQYLRKKTDQTIEWATLDIPDFADMDESADDLYEIPSVSGQAGKFLSTNGTSVSWQTVTGGTASGLVDGAALVVNGNGATNCTTGVWNKLNFNNAVDWNGLAPLDAHSGNDQFTVSGTGIYLITMSGNIKITCGNADSELALYVDNAQIDNTRAKISATPDENWVNFSLSGIVSHTANTARTYEVKYTNSYPTGWQCSGTSYVLETQGVTISVHKIF